MDGDMMERMPLSSVTNQQTNSHIAVWLYTFP